jgi:hypothetical protein
MPNPKSGQARIFFFIVFHAVSSKELGKDASGAHTHNQLGNM